MVWVHGFLSRIEKTLYCLNCLLKKWIQYWQFSNLVLIFPMVQKCLCIWRNRLWNRNVLANLPSPLYHIGTQRVFLPWLLLICLIWYYLTYQDEEKGWRISCHRNSMLFCSEIQLYRLEIAKSVCDRSKIKNWRCSMWKLTKKDRIIGYIGPKWVEFGRDDNRHKVGCVFGSLCCLTRNSGKMTLGKI